MSDTEMNPSLLQEPLNASTESITPMNDSAPPLSPTNSTSPPLHHHEQSNDNPLFLPGGGSQSQPQSENEISRPPSAPMEPLIQTDQQQQPQGGRPSSGQEGDIQVDQQPEDEEEDQLATDSERESQQAPQHQDGTATGQGGATPGPGPSSVANHNNSKKRPQSNSPQTVQPSKPKKQPRISQAQHLQNGSYLPPPLPHYTVVRSTGTNSASNPHVIKINAGVTDASSSRWPLAAERDPNHKKDGKTYWYECQPRDVGKHKSFLFAVGHGLAKKMSLLGKGGQKEHWTLESLPENYLFTVHHCITSSGQARVDSYMFGSPATAKFRTANEMIPHLHWLIQHGPDDKLRCSCKYCAKKLQGDVNKIEGLEEKRTSSSVAPVGGGGGTTTTREKKPRPSSNSGPSGSTTATTNTNGGKVRSSTYNADEPEPSYSGAFVDKTRDIDLTIGGPTYRFGELVWAELPQPLTSKLKEWESIKMTHWPAIVSGRNEKTSSSTERPYIQGRDLNPKFVNLKRWTYQVSYLATRDEAESLEEDQVKNWLSLPPPNDLWSEERMKNPKSVARIWDGQKVRKASLGELKDLEDAVTPAALSMQIAAHIVGAFSLIDRFTIKPSHIVRANPNSTSPEEEAAIDSSLKDWQYQSMYWGAEMIWVNDFVRIIETGTTLPPDHERSTTTNSENNKKSKPSAIFLHVQSIYKEQESKHGKLAGHLYELRDLRDVAAFEGPGQGSIGLTNGESAMSLFEKNPTPPATSDGSTVPFANGGGGGGGGASSPAKKKNDQDSSMPSFVPVAPEGYEFHRLTDPKGQVHIDLDYLAGRYYPLPTSMNSRFKIDEIVDSFPNLDEVEASGGGGADEEEAELKGAVLHPTEEQRAVIVAGLRPAIDLYMKCTSWQSDRMQTLVASETKACNEVSQYFEDNVEETD